MINLLGQSETTNPSQIHELVTKYESLKESSRTLLNVFTIEELNLLRTYYGNINSMNVTLGGFEYEVDDTNIDPITRAIGSEGMYGNLYKFDINIPAVLNLIGPSHPEEFCGALKLNNRDEAYTLRYNGDFHSLDIHSGEYTYLGTLDLAEWLVDMAFNPVDGKLYGISNSTLYEIDPINLTVETIGGLNTYGIDAVSIAINGEGNAYTYDLYDDKLYSIDLSTGNSTPLGYIGFNASYVQAMAWDPQSDKIYMAAFNGDFIVSELRSVNLETGMTTNLGQIGTSVLEFYWLDFYTEEHPNVGTCDLDGETNYGATYHRTTEDGLSLDENGENVFHSLYGYFHVNQTGTYTITSTQDGWDGMIFLYKNNFDRLNPMVNFVAGNDNFGTVGTSQLTVELEAGTLYYLVTTGLNSEEFGTYETTINGNGNIYCNNGIEELGCDWTVTVSGHTYGHFISWKLTSGEDLLLSGGQYITNGFTDTKHTTTSGPLTFSIESGENVLGGSAEYVISNGDQIVASGQIVPGNQKVFTNLNCTVLVEGCFEAPLGQFPSEVFTPSCTEGPETISDSAKTGEYTLVNLTEETQYIFSSSVETDFITIANENGTLAYVEGTGVVSFTPLTSGVYRFYLHLNDECEYSSTELRSKFIECVTTLGPPSNDDCENAIPVSCGDVKTGNIYFATDSGGTTASRDVFYKYTGNGQPEIVTLSLCNSAFDSVLSVYTDCTLSNRIMYNDNYCGQASQLSFYSDGTTTYYILIEGSSDVWLGSYELEVTCEADEDDYDPCALEQSGNLATGLSITNNQYGQFRAANDFNVLANTQFELEKIKLQVYSTDGEPTKFDVSFHVGENGVGAQFGETILALSPSSVLEVGVHSYANYPVYDVELTLPNTVIFPATATGDKKYWIGLKAEPSVNSGIISWGSLVKYSPHTMAAWKSEDGGNSWYEYEYGPDLRLDGIMSLEGECATLGMDDAENTDFTYYPNPTNHIVNFTTQKEITSIQIFNLAGQLMINAQKANEKHINISSLPKGTYLFKVQLDNQQIETFKIIKK